MWLILFLAATAPAQTTQPAPILAPREGTIQLPVGRSAVVAAPWAIKRVSVAHPEVADVQVATPNQVVVIGKSIGTTDIVLWGEDGTTIQREVRINIDLHGIEAQVAQMFPTATLRVMQSQDAVVVSGSLRRAEEAAQLDAYLKALGAKYVDTTNVAGVHQVMIQVRVAEASRTAIRALGINAVVAGTDFFGGSTIGGNPNNINVGVPAGANASSNIPFKFNSSTAISPTTTLFAGFPSADLEIFLSALSENQYIRILAEPTLIALSGQEASFLAGGEFPIPIVQGTTSGGGTAISIEFKEFGVRLKFRPTVLGDNSIRLFVAPEVSALSDVGAVIIQDFRIPSIATRRAETTLEIKSGQTFAMAGLMDHNINARTSRVPGLGDVPVLGALFRSVRYERGETELVVLVKASLVEPISETGARPLPGDTHIEPNDWELFANGQIEGSGPARRHAHGDWMSKRGLHRLKGPGAWADHDHAQ